MLVDRLLSPQQPNYTTQSIHQICEQISKLVKLVSFEKLEDVTLVLDHDLSLPELIHDPESE